MIIRSFFDGFGTDLNVQSMNIWSDCFNRFIPSVLAQTKNVTIEFRKVISNFPLKNCNPLIVLHNGAY
jgi:hypothetical protein